MNTWILILFMGRIVAVDGPTYGDRMNCIATRLPQTMAQRAPFQKLLPPGRRIQDMTFDCVTTATKPRVGDRT